MIPNKQRGWKTALVKVQQTKEPLKLTSNFAPNPYLLTRFVGNWQSKSWQIYCYPLAEKKKKINDNQ